MDDVIDGGGRAHTGTEDLVAAEIRRRRHAAGWSQRDLAKRAGFSREYVSRAERTSSGLPSESLISVLDAVFGAGGALLDLWSAAAGARRSRRQDLARAGVADLDAAAHRDGGVLGQSPLPVSGSPTMDAATGSAALLAELVAGEVDPLMIDDIEEGVDALARGYFRSSPAAFRGAVVLLRERVRDLVAVRSPLRQRRRLYAALAALTAMLAESSFAVGDQSDVHCAAALALAEEAGHADLVGWVRGTQAQIALHSGSPRRDALCPCRMCGASWFSSAGSFGHLPGPGRRPDG